MKYDFDALVQRRNTNSVKYDFAAENGVPEDAIPLWVADMDFSCPPCVKEALSRVVQQGIYGYTGVKPDYTQAVAGWFSRRFQWNFDPKAIVMTPGVIFGITGAVATQSEPGDAVMIHTPVYGPFFDIVKKTGRTLITNPLVLRDGKYFIDFEDFENKIIQNHVKIFILCSPHNPTGRVWEVDELHRIAAICKKHSVKVISDEIHCDFTHEGFVHTPFLKANPDMADSTIVCTAPSKTFNVAGLQTSNIIIPDAQMKKQFEVYKNRCSVFTPNLMGLAACKAAYTDGDEWVDQLNEYITGNLAFVRSYLAEHIPQIRLIEPQGTYFAWIDCTELGMNSDELDHFMRFHAKLWLDKGDIFGEEYGQYQRMLLSCPRSILQKAMQQLEQAVAAVGK